MKQIKHWKNTSEFPDAWARPCVEWLLSRCEWHGLPPFIQIQRGIQTGASGRAYRSHVFVRIRRRSPRRSFRETRFKWDGQPHEVRNAAEAFVWILGHELHHASPLGQQEVRTLAHSSYEYRANLAGDRAVEEYRAGAGAKLRHAYASTLRRTRVRDARRVAAAQAREARDSAPETRVAKLREQAARWQTKAKRAATALAKIRRRISAIESAALRAAKRGAP